MLITRACVRQVSPDERMVAWAEDRRGNEAYYLRVRDIATGKDLLQQPIKVGALASVITSCLALSQHMCARHSRCVTSRLRPAEKPGQKGCGDRVRPFLPPRSRVFHPCRSACGPPLPKHAWLLVVCDLTLQRFHFAGHLGRHGVGK